jgi:hypothetical protein
VPCDVFCRSSSQPPRSPRSPRPRSSTACRPGRPISDDDRALLDHLVAPFAPHPASQLARAAPPPAQDDGTAWWPIAGAAAAALALLALLARYATSALKARPRASKSAN